MALLMLQAELTKRHTQKARLTIAIDHRNLNAIQSIMLKAK